MVCSSVRIQAYVKDSGLETTERNTIKTDQNMMTNLTGVFAACDAHRGQSIVAWAIGEGRDVARLIETSPAPRPEGCFLS